MDKLKINFGWLESEPDYKVSYMAYLMEKVRKSYHWLNEKGMDRIGA